MDEKITQEQYLKLLDKVEDAEKDTTPYVAVNDEGEIFVQGDPNNTKVVKRNYTARFVFPEYMAKDFPGAEYYGQGYYKVEIEYPDIFVDARNNMKYVRAIAQCMPFLRKLRDDGGVDNLTTDEAIDLWVALSDDIIDALYHIMEVVLGVDEEILGFMAPGSVIRNATQIVEDFPPIVNQGDLFFDLPTTER